MYYKTVHMRYMVQGKSSYMPNYYKYTNEFIKNYTISYQYLKLLYYNNCI